MRKIAIVYWSGTGNTEAMAAAVAEGVQASEAVLETAAAFDVAALDAYDAVAFGCPSMGAEELEESEFAPMFETCERKLAGKQLALFGSYGWGDGEWMRNWEERCRDDGAALVCEPVICNEAPDAAALAALTRYDWPGNLRQLKNTVKSATLLAAGDYVTCRELPAEVTAPSTGAAAGNPTVPSFSLRDPASEEEQIRRALAAAGGNKSQAAKLLGVDRKTLYNKLHHYGIE